MTTLVVLFNLKEGADRDAYERWAVQTDLATVRKLPSVAGFQVLKSHGLFGSDDPAPYDYIEILELRSLDGLVSDVSSATMRKVASEFREFADDPKFLVTEPLD